MHALQEIEAQRDKLGRVQQDAEKAEEKFRMEKERLMEKAERTEMQYQRAKAEKEGVELNLMKLTRDLENLQHEHKELRELRGVEETRTRSERSDNQRIAMELEDLHHKYDRAQLEIKQLAEDKDKFEVESRKFRNQLDHARASLDHSYENETTLKQDAEAAKRELARAQDKLEQSEAELRRVTREKDQFSASQRARDANADKLELEISQLTSERDQLVRQLEKSQDMLLSFQQDLNLTENELKRITAENRRLKDEADQSENAKLDSKEREIRSLNDKVRAMEFDYDEALQRHAR